MPKGLGTLFIVHSYLEFLYSCFLRDFIYIYICVRVCVCVCVCVRLLILTVYQSVLGYFMPKGLWILFILSLYLEFLYSCFLRDFLYVYVCVGVYVTP